MKRKWLLLLCFLPQLLSAQTGWTGTFSSKYGELKLVEEYGFEYPDGGIIYGDYGNKGTITGTLKDKATRFEGYFFNGSASGKFSLAWSYDKKGFTGTWGYGEETNAYSTNADFQWTGTQKTKSQPAQLNTCVLSGKWNTNHGYIILQQTGNKITGKYHTVGTLDGIYDPATKKVKGTFTNNNQKGYFEWDLQGNNYKGKWGWTTAMTGGEWTGNKLVKTNKEVTPAPTPAASTTTTAGNSTVKFSIRPVSLLSLGSIYGFAGVQVLKLTSSGSEEIKSFGHKSSYFFNTTEDKIVANGNTHNFSNTLDNIRDFIISQEDLRSGNTELQLKIFMHLKKEQIGPNKDYKYKTITLNLKHVQTGPVKLRSDIGPEIVQLELAVTRQ